MKQWTSLHHSSNARHSCLAACSCPPTTPIAPLHTPVCVISHICESMKHVSRKLISIFLFESKSYSLTPTSIELVITCLSFLSAGIMILYPNARANRF